MPVPPSSTRHPCGVHHAPAVDPEPRPRLREVPEVPPPEPFTYDNDVAEHYADHGYHDFAALLEAGYACSACHLTHQLNRIPSDEELDLERFEAVAGVMRKARVAVEVFATAFMGAQASLKVKLSQSSPKIVALNAADPLDAITLKQIGETIASDPIARRAYQQLQAQGTEVYLEFGPPALGETAMGEANRLHNFVVVRVGMHRSAHEAVSTLVHEASHMHRHFRGGRPSQLDEFRAFAREFLYNQGRRPTAAERAAIWRDVEAHYAHLPRRP